MSVFPNKQRRGEWRYDFWLNKKRHQGACVDANGRPATTEKQARGLEEEAKRLAALTAKTGRAISRPRSFTLGQAMLLHIDSQVGSSPAHVANLKLYARELLAYFGTDTPVAEVSQSLVDQYRRHASSERVTVWRAGPRSRKATGAKAGKGARVRSPVSVNHRLNCLRSALAQAHRIKDPTTGQPLLPFPPTVSPVPVPKRKPAPMPDAELFRRLKVAPPWVREAAELARYFGLRRTEALAVTLDHIDRGERALRFDGATTKSGRDEFARPVPGGWELLERLARQARARGVAHLVTWPGPAHMAAFLAGGKVPAEAWRPLTSIRRAWRGTAARAGIKGAHRLHDVRARYITEVARAAPAFAQEAARHQDPATTAGYIAFAAPEVSRALESVPRPKKRA